MRRPITPCPLLMPHKVVQHRGLDANGSRDEVMPPSHVNKEGNNRELNQHPGETHRVEGNPASC